MYFCTEQELQILSPVIYIEMVLSGFVASRDTREWFNVITTDNPLDQCCFNHNLERTAFNIDG